MSKISWIIFTVITVGLLAALVIFSDNKSLDVSNIDVNTIQTANDQNGNIGEHIYGNADSTVTLINYGDFQCSACAYYHATIKSVTEEYKSQIRFVFRNFPLGSSHPNGRAAAAVVEAAGLQGKYWEMYNKIYESQDSWTNLSGTTRTDFFAKEAEALELDMTKFKSDIASTSVSDKINYDKALGIKADVTGTPALFLNGTKVESAALNDATKFKALIDAELEKAN